MVRLGVPAHRCHNVLTVIHMIILSLSLIHITKGAAVSRTFITERSTDNRLRLPVSQIRQFCEGTPLLTRYGQPITTQHVTIQSLADTQQYSSCNKLPTSLADFALGMVSTYLKVCYYSRECSSKSYIKQDLGYECSNPQESQSFYNDLRLQITIYCSPTNPDVLSSTTTTTNPPTQVSTPVAMTTRGNTRLHSTTVRQTPPPVFPQVKETTLYIFSGSSTSDDISEQVTDSTTTQEGSIESGADRSISDGGSDGVDKNRLFEYKEAVIIMSVILVIVISVSVCVIVYFIKCRGVVLLHRKSSHSSRDSGPPSRQALYSRVSLGSASHKERYVNNSDRNNKLNEGLDCEYTSPDHYSAYEIPEEEDDTYETVDLDLLKRSTAKPPVVPHSLPLTAPSSLAPAVKKNGKINSISSPMYGAKSPAGPEYMIPVISKLTGGDNLPKPHVDSRYTEGYLVPVPSISKTVSA